ncbi:aldehyde dehydrogenase family protein [Klebsiella variicola]
MSLTNKLFINGKWVLPVKGGTFDTIDPANEVAIAQVAAATKEDVDLAVQAAREAFDKGGWPELSGKQRAHYLRRIASLIRDKQQMLAELEVRDNGKPLPEALWDIGDTAYCFDFYANLAEELDDQREKEVPLPDDRFSSVARQEPVGVCGAIIPWNFPMLMAAWKVAPALAAGCTVVLKPSEVTPLTALQLAEIARETELPPGVLNVITGFGADAGSPLTEHPDVDKIAFTGSVPTGRKIMQTAAADIKNVSLELGGKSAFIVFDDSDIDKAVEWILFGIFWNKGEVCSATSRVLVQRGIYDALLSRLVQEAEKIHIGNGMQADVLLGPLVNVAQYEKVTRAITQGIKQGATLLSGGQRPADKEKGFFLQPTIFTDMSEESDIWCEEVFGPVVCVRAFDDEAQAVASANRSRFGLAAAVMSTDTERAERVARKLRAGIVWVNCSQPTFIEAPWGGYKQSGIGRELGEWGLNNYLETKQITRYDSEEPWGWYLK